MRLLRLHLNAFGPFTNFSIDLSQGQEGLHLLWGPNEAGKSSALRALESLFYGLEGNEADAFLHPASKLAIGAEFRSSHGDVISVVRRRGRERSLLNSQGEIIKEEDSPWGSVLRPLDRQAFQRMFGLNQFRLSQGGQELVRGKGDLGQILFSAAGQTDLRDIQDTLRSDYQQLFIKKGRNQELPLLFAEFHAKKKLLREQGLPQHVWQGLEQEIATRTALRSELEEQRRRTERRCHELSSLRKAKAWATQRGEIQENLLTLHHVPRLDPTFTTTRIDTERSQSITLQQIEDTQERLSLLTKDRDELHPNRALIDAFAQVEALYRQLGDTAKAERHLRKLQADLMIFERRMGEALVQLGLSPDTMQPPSSLRLKAGDAEEIQQTGRQLYKAEEKRSDVQGELLEIEHLLSSTADGTCPDVDLASIQALEMLVLEIRREGNLESEIQQAEAKRTLDRKNIEADIRRLGFAKATMESLPSIPIPRIETVDQFDSDLKDLTHRYDSQRHSHDDLLRNRDQTQDQIRLLDPDDSIPSEQQLLALRLRRDQAWQEIEAKFYLREAGIQSPLSQLEIESTVETVAQFKQFLVETDFVADRLRREADRVQRKIGLSDQVRVCNAKLDASSNALMEVQQALEQWKHRWSQLWPELSSVPTTPKEGIAWIRQCNDIVLAIREWNVAMGQLKARIQLILDFRQKAIRHLGSDTGEFANDTLAFLLQRLDIKFKEGKTKFEFLQERQQELKQLRSTKRRKEGLLRDLEEKCQMLRAAWGEKLLPLNISADTSLESVAIQLEIVRDLWTSHDRVSELRSQIDQLVLEKNALAGQIDLLRARFPREAGSESEFIDGLLRDARTATHEQQQLLKIEEQSSELEGRLRQLQEEANKYHTLMTSLCKQAGTDSAEALPRVEEEARRRLDLEQQLGRLNGFLDSLRESVPLNEFCEKALGLMELTADQELDQLEVVRKDCEHKIGVETQAIWELERKRSDTSKNEEAACTAQGLQDIYAKAEGRFRDYQKYRLASGILQLAVEKYRQKNEDRLIRRAGELFGQLTCGVYSGLGVEPNADTGPMLVGLRIHDKSRVDVTGMSDGTRDQLFLALRMATLEAFLGSHEAIPFVADDLLIHFDDQRAIAALKVLGEFSRQTQVLFFTHHQHLIDLALTHLEPQICFVHSFSP